MELGGRGREGLHGQGSGGLGAAPHGAVQGQRVLLLALRGDSGLQPRPGNDAPQPPGPSTGPPASPHGNGTALGSPWHLDRGEHLDSEKFTKCNKAKCRALHLAQDRMDGEQPFREGPG